MSTNREALGLIRTQLTLLSKMAESRLGVSEAAWGRFFDLYYPAMLKYAQLYCTETDAEDIVQDVLRKLVDVLRENRYSRRTGNTFRGYLKTLIRNEFLDYRRRELVRGANKKIPFGVGAELSRADADSVVAAIDVEWRVALRQSAQEHVLTQTAITENERRAYLGYVVEERPAAVVAKELGVTVNYVYLSKSRIEKRIAAFEELYGN